ncbi:MAG: preprotein translocase subunit SecE [Piscirickettsiaceae bacterium]|nr:preprotein translocase subunit SecE [Piscirickettsiaceae bacterium]
MADNIKLIIAVIIMVSAIALFYSYEEVSTLLRVLGLLTAAGLSVFIASKTAVGSTMLSYLRSTQVEVRKVVWPSRQETVQTTMIVLIMVLLVALMLWGVDSLLGWGVRALTL